MWDFESEYSGLMKSFRNAWILRLQAFPIKWRENWSLMWYLVNLSSIGKPLKNFGIIHITLNHTSFLRVQKLITKQASNIVSFNIKQYISVIFILRFLFSEKQFWRQTFIFLWKIYWRKYFTLVVATFFVSFIFYEKKWWKTDGLKAH